jgi:uncharacterized membrane protein YeaQ/YmgE (transglycosylase-associated protein family)
MSIIIWLVWGGLIGWLASMVMGTNDRQGLVLNVLVGIAGAFLGGWLLGSAFGTSTINEGNLSMSGLFVSSLGSLILLVVARLARVTQ